MGYDDVIPLLGNFGRYQKRIYFLLCLPAIVCAFHKLANVFLNAKPDYRAYLKALGDAIFMLGVMLGSIGFGELSDRYGRKLIFFISLVIQVVFGLLAAVAPEFWTFTFSRTIVGASTSGVFLVAYVIAMEMVGPSDRLSAGVICQMFFSCGYMLTALFAYYITDWRSLQIALTVPGLIFFTYWWLIPESARWLITQNRVPEAKRLIQKAALENKVVISDKRLTELLKADVKPPNSDEKKATILDVFRHANLRRRALIIFFVWFVNSMTYYGSSWNPSNPGDYLDFVISGAVEIPAYCFLLLTLNRCGRKSILCGCMVVSGIALLLVWVVPESYNWLSVTLVVIERLAITASYGTVYIFSVEQFPTVIRNAALGACATSAVMGSIFALLINLMSKIWAPLPEIIYGVLVLVGGAISLMLPETRNKTLPDSIPDDEKFGKKQKVSAEEMPLKVVTTDKKQASRKAKASRHDNA